MDPDIHCLVGKTLDSTLRAPLAWSFNLALKYITPLLDYGLKILPKLQSHLWISRLDQNSSTRDNMIVRRAWGF
jgi:hypothetical protein